MSPLLLTDNHRNISFISRKTGGSVGVRLGVKEPEEFNPQGDL